FPISLAQKGRTGGRAWRRRMWFDAETRRRGARRGGPGGRERDEFAPWCGGDSGGSELRSDRQAEACPTKAWWRVNRLRKGRGGGGFGLTRRRGGAEQDAEDQEGARGTNSRRGAAETAEGPSCARIDRLKPVLPKLDEESTGCEGVWRGRRVEGVVTKGGGVGGVSGVGGSCCGGGGCAGGSGFCDANRSITRTPPGRRRKWTSMPASASGRMDLLSRLERAWGVGQSGRRGSSSVAVPVQRGVRRRKACTASTKGLGGDGVSK